MTRAEAIKAAQAVVRTKHYQQLRSFWIARREQLLQANPASDAELWQIWGALRELTLNLQGTDLMVDYLESTSDEQTNKYATMAPPSPPWLMQSAGVDLA